MVQKAIRYPGHDLALHTASGAAGITARDVDGRAVALGRILDNGGETFNAKHDLFGCKGGVKRITDAQIALGEATVYSPSGQFTNLDPGSDVELYGAGLDGGVLITTIQSFTNANYVVLAAPAQTAIASGGEMRWGHHNDTAALQLLFDAIEDGRRGVAVLPPDGYWFSSELILQGTVDRRILGALIHGRGATLYQKAVDLGSDGISVKYCNNVAFEELRILGPGTNFVASTGVGAFLLHYHASVDKGWMTGLEVEGFKGMGALDHSGAGRCFARDCIIKNTTFGIWQTSLDGELIATGNIIETSLAQGQSEGQLHFTSSPKGTAIGNTVKVPDTVRALTFLCESGALQGNTLIGGGASAVGVEMRNSSSKGVAVKGNPIIGFGVGITLCGRGHTVQGNPIIGAAAGPGRVGIRLHYGASPAEACEVSGNQLDLLDVGISDGGLAVDRCQIGPNNFGASVTKKHDLTAATSSAVMDPRGFSGFGNPTTNALRSPEAIHHVVAYSDGKAAIWEGSTKEPTLEARYWVTNPGGAPHYKCYKARGSKSAPAAVAAGDELGGYGFAGRDSAGGDPTTAEVRAITTEAWSGTARGTRLALEITRNGQAAKESGAELSTPAADETALLVMRNTGGVVTLRRVKQGAQGTGPGGGTQRALYLDD